MDLQDSLQNEIRWAFRGQSQDFGTLIPSFQREFSRQSHPAAQLIEARLISDFRTHYATLPDRSSDMPRPDQIDARYDLRCLSVMQHYEIPTRLVDWTSNFWIAVYFACASAPGLQAEWWCYDRALFDAQRWQNQSLVSLLNTTMQPPTEPQFLGLRDSELLVELDPKITPRMKQQQAHHTVSANVFSDHAPLLAALADSVPSPTATLRRILIAASCKPKALQFLADHQKLTAGTIFPDVVGLGRFLRWQFESLRTMLL
jgi:FRG domain-containing protein